MKPVVGAILRKLTAVLPEKKKPGGFLCGILLGLLVVVVMPISVVLSLFQSKRSVSGQLLQNSVQEDMQEEELAALQQAYDSLGDLDAAMEEAGFAERKKEAEVLFVMALSDCTDKGHWVATLVECFEEEQSDQELVTSVNEAFDVPISVEPFTKIMQRIRSVAISTSGYIDMTTKNNLDLVQWAIHAERAGWGYVWGTHGQVLSEAQLEASLSSYPQEVGQYEDFIRVHWLGRRTTDCVGLIKGYGWFQPDTGEVRYGSNGMPDLDADSMYRSAAEKGGIDTIPEIPGVAVWRTGHIGIYIGGGEVIEAMGTKYGVVRTALSDRGWTHWLKIPAIEYRTEETDDSSV